MSNLAVRADASRQIGTGHVMRMLALGQSAIEAGWSVTFLIHECPEALLDRLKGEGCEVIMLPVETSGGTDDAAFVVSECQDKGSEWIVVDGYQFSPAYQQALQAKGLKVLLVDDYAHHESYPSDAILNQNLFATPSLYARATEGTRFLTGGAFTLLRREFIQSGVEQRGSDASEAGRAVRVMLTVGGADPEGFSDRLVASIDRVCRGVEVRMVVGAGFDRVPGERGDDAPNQFRVLENPPDMANQMADVDAVISGAGSTVWEALFLNKGLLAFSLVENQVLIGEFLKASDVAEYGGHLPDLSDADIDAAIGHFFTRLRESGGSPWLKTSIDQWGSARVLKFLEGRPEVTLATSEGGWFSGRNREFAEEIEALGAEVLIAGKEEELTGGDVLILLSWRNVVPPEVLSQYKNAVVVHASDLPEGRGWSPMIWQVIEGRNQFTYSLLEADESVDAGVIYLQEQLSLSGGELVDELRDLQTQLTYSLCREFIINYPQVLSQGRAQSGEGSWYPRRGPDDSRLDPEKSISDQFNLLRTVDNEQYPAFFEIRGARYLLKIEKDEREGIQSDSKSK